MVYIDTSKTTATLMAGVAKVIQPEVVVKSEYQEKATCIELPGNKEIWMLHAPDKREGVKAIHLDVASYEELYDKREHLKKLYPDLNITSIEDLSEELDYTYQCFKVYITRDLVYEVRYRTW